MPEFANYDVEDTIATVTIDRPEKRNAMDESVRKDIRTAFERAEADDDVRVIVLRGSGDAFSAGGDLEFYSQLEMVDALDFVEDHVGGLTGLYTYVERVSKPTIAAVDGWALGGGTEIAVACDFRLASPRAKFGTTEMRVGLYPVGGAGQRLLHLVGLAETKEMVFTGKIIDAEEADEIGLVNHVYEEDAFEEEVYGFADSIASKSPIALRLAKASIHRAMNIEAGLEFDKVAGSMLYGTEDQKEGARAFLEDRDPEFTGR